MLPCLEDPGAELEGILECTCLCIPSFCTVLWLVSDLEWGHLCSWGMTGVRSLSGGGCPCPWGMLEFSTP